MACLKFRHNVFNSLRIPKRYNKWQSRNPREPHYDRKKMLEICKPIHVKPFKQPWETCPLNSVLPAVEAHPYEKLLAKELEANWFSSRMICFFHVNPMRLMEETEVRKSFMKKDLFFHIYTEAVAKLVLDKTPYESCLHLMKSAETAFVFGATPMVKDVLKLNAKLIPVILLAGLIDGVFFSKNQLAKYDQMPSIDVLHAQLSGLLDSRKISISQTISQPSQLLCQYLKQYSEDKES